MNLMGSLYYEVNLSRLHFREINYAPSSETLPEEEGDDRADHL